MLWRDRAASTTTWRTPTRLLGPLTLALLHGPLAEVHFHVDGVVKRANRVDRRAVTIPGGVEPLLQSVRRAVSYAIASTATCAPLGAEPRFRIRSAPQVPRPDRPDLMRGTVETDGRAGRRRRNGDGTLVVVGRPTGIVRLQAGAR
jgi:hypothetical protein